MQVNIKVARVHEAQMQNENAKREISAIQEYIDRCVTDLVDNKIYFVPLRGNYTHVKRTMVLNGVIISTMQDDVVGIAGKLHTDIKGSEAEVADMVFEFPPEFLGKISYAEGFPIHFEMSVKGLVEDMQILTSALQCSVEEVKVLRLNKEGHE